MIFHEFKNDTYIKQSGLEDVLGSSYAMSHCANQARQWCNILMIQLGFRSDQISRSVMSDSLRPHKSQHARPPCPSPTPGVHSDSCPLSQ